MGVTFLNLFSSSWFREVTLEEELDVFLIFFSISNFEHGLFLLFSPSHSVMEATRSRLSSPSDLKPNKAAPKYSCAAASRRDQRHIVMALMPLKKCSQQFYDVNKKKMKY